MKINSFFNISANVKKKYLYLPNNLIHTPMEQLTLTAIEQSVLNLVQQEHLTSFEILKKVENVTLILSLYNIIDQLNSKGVLKSYIKENKKYHYAAA